MVASELTRHDGTRPRAIRRERMRPHNQATNLRLRNDKGPASRGLDVLSQWCSARPEGFEPPTF